MSLKNVTKNKDNTAVLEFEISKADFDVAVNAVYRKKAGRVTIPGFRKGKAPRAIIEKMYGKGFFYEDALNDLLPDVLDAALSESGLEVVSRPELDITEIGDNGVVGTAKYFTKPEIKVTSYKGLEAVKYTRKVSAKDVDLAIERTRERNAREVEVTDRPAEMGDTAVIDYKGSVDGVAFDGGADKGHHLKLGSGQFIPGFEEQIVGHNVGDEFDVNVTFPAEYHAEDLKGKDAVFSVKLCAIEKTELPELDDEFAKDVSEFDTLKEYKADVKRHLQEQNDKSAADAADAELTDALIAKISGDIPACMFEDEAENMLRDYEYNMSQQGISMEMYMQYTGQTIEKMKEELLPRAERQVKTRLALEFVAGKEKIQPSKEELDAEYERLAAAYGMDAEKVRELLSEDVLAKDLAMKAAFDFVRANAKIEEKPFEDLEKKATAKKPAAKKSTAKKAEDGAEPKPAAKKTTAAKKADGEEKKPAAKKPAAKKTAEKKEAE